MNEPGPMKPDFSAELGKQQSAELWLEVHDEVIKAIRDICVKNIIVLDDHYYACAWGYYGGKNSWDSACI